MSTIIITVMATAAIAGPAGYCFDHWWPRHRGRHSTKDGLQTVAVLQERAEESALRDQETHQLPTVDVEPDPDITDTGPRLLSGRGSQSVLCGQYGGKPEPSQWPTTSIA